MSTFFKLFTAVLFFTLPILVSANDVNKQPSANTTTVYKIVHPDGSVSYSDQPQDNSTRMEVEPITTIPAFKPIKSTILTGENTTSDKPYYDSLIISNPSNGSVFHSGSGDILASIQVNPPLRADDRIRFTLDGVEINIQKSTSLQLNNVNRGTHIIRADIITPQNEVATSGQSQFTVHRPIARSR